MQQYDAASCVVVVLAAAMLAILCRLIPHGGAAWGTFTRTSTKSMPGTAGAARKFDWTSYSAPRPS